MPGKEYASSMNAMDRVQRVISVIQTINDTEKVGDGVSQDFADGYELALSNVIEALREIAEGA
jgi:hypothetical protein